MQYIYMCVCVSVCEFGTVRRVQSAEQTCWGGLCCAVPEPKTKGVGGTFELHRPGRHRSHHIVLTRHSTYGDNLFSMLCQKGTGAGVGAGEW